MNIKSLSRYITCVSFIIILMMIFVLPNKVNAANSFNLNHSNSLFDKSSYQENPTSTPTEVPPSGYERPVLVVLSYQVSQDKINPGDYFSMDITVYNAGQHYAKNIVAVFTTGDLIPRDTGGVIAIGEIAPGNRMEFSQSFILSTGVWTYTAATNMQVTYTDESGVPFNETFALTIPVYYPYSAAATATPTPTASPTPSSKPQLVITNYSSDINPLQPGLQFTLKIDLKNVGTSLAKRITMIVGGGSGNSGNDGGTQQPGGISGGSGEFTNFAPIGSSNVQSLGELSSGSELTVQQTLIVNTNTAPGAYPLKISFVYVDEQNHSYTDDQVVTLLIYRLPLLDINFYQQVQPFFAGSPNMLPLQVVNLGRNSVVLGNMVVKADKGQLSNNSILVGALEPGGYFTLDASYIPDLAGPVDLIVSIDYTNDFNQPQVISKTITIDVIDQPIIEPPVDGGQSGGEIIVPTQPETFLQKVWRFVLGLIGLDSGVVNTQSPEINQPTDGNSQPEGPVIVPAKPPLKGP